MDASDEDAANEPEEKELENKEMTLEKHEKILEENRKALLVLKTEEMKVDVKEFESMQQLSNKKSNNDIFIKLGSEKDNRKDADKEEKVEQKIVKNELLQKFWFLRGIKTQCVGRANSCVSKDGHPRVNPTWIQSNCMVDLLVNFASFRLHLQKERNRKGKIKIKDTNF